MRDLARERPGAAAQTLPFRRAATVLNAWQRNVDTTIDWADPSWTAALLKLDADQLEHVREAMQAASVAARMACSRALVRAAGVVPPDFADLTQGAAQAGAHANAAWLDALPAERGVQVLRMRALLFRRAEVRRLIDKRTRQQLSDWVGVSVDRLTQDAHAGEPPDTARLIARAGMPPLAALDAARLAIEGCALLLRDLASSVSPTRRVPFTLLRLALPRALPPVPWLAQTPADIDAPGSARLFARLPDLLPEYPWLSG
ncbi:type III secretion protein HrpB4 [Paraburkholderia tropica]|uniref:type III secretion protein HrpB4 n=1 Tax=Paraburkholderia tropica TaxID=92647 RepID=UPI0007EC355F|nr:type III secretion protein HrpB4 [Paraburkholderia tropica]MBB2980364.1 type III secretion system HrpB4-like protein [Paraburkholderia tropica]